jgi:hypothetical protein
VVAHKVGKMKTERGWNQPIWVPKEVIINMKGPQMAWVPKDMLTLLSLITRYALTVTAPGMPIGTCYHSYWVDTPRDETREHLW